MNSTTILALMVFLIPPHYQKHNQESEKAATTRYITIAEAIADEAETPTLALFLLAVARHESSFRRDVHNGSVKGDAGRSWGLFQIFCGRSPNAVVPRTPYRAKNIIGTSLEATSRAVKAAAIWLRLILPKCRNRPFCVFRRYGNVSRNAPPEVLQRLRARTRTYQRLKARYRDRVRQRAVSP